LDEEPGRAVRSADHLVLGAAVALDELEPGGSEHLALELRLAEVAVGEEDEAHPPAGARSKNGSSGRA
jgi:hypothetical protein